MNSSRLTPKLGGGVGVGRTGVAVGRIGVGGIGVAVGAIGVGVGGIGVEVGGIGVGIGCISSVSPHARVMASTRATEIHTTVGRPFISTPPL